MALTEEEAQAHIRKWEGRLTKPAYPHRKLWPSRLFHHAPLENAVMILAQGCFRSRNDPANEHPRDIAAQGVIDLRVDAHDFVRLYFRPRTPTQFHIEGIRKSHECGFGRQAPILIMFVLDAKNVLTRDDTFFSDENMQRHTALTGSDAKFLDEIPFEKVFHEGGLGGDNSIIAHRCAEVLAASPLLLSDALQWVFCRSDAERETLRFAIGPDHPWHDRIRVSDDIRVFNREYCYVESVQLSPEGVLLALHPRKDGQRIDLQVYVLDQIGAVVAEFRNESIAANPPNARKWRIQTQLQPGRYRVKVWIEQETAYDAELELGDNLF